MRLPRVRLRRLLPLLVALVLLPRSGDAVNDAQCCNLATSFATSLFGGGNGDEDFFSVPAGSPNLMILLGNSSSMLDFANALPFPAAWTSTYGTCNVPELDALATKALATPAPGPYDNGFSSATALTTDSPPWGTGRCTAGSGNCLFTASSYYYYPTVRSGTQWVGKVGTGGLGDKTVSWTTDGAKEYASATDVNLCNQDSKTGRVKDATECSNCLATKGYYLFLDQLSANSAAQQTAAAIFRGSFLNVSPPKFVIARKVVKDLARIDTASASPIDNVRFGLAVLRPKTSGSGNPTNRMGNTDGGELVVPLGPNCSVYPARPEDMTAPRQAVIDAVNDATKVSFYSSSGEIMNQLGEALYNLGQYYSGDTGSSTNPYTRLFGTTWISDQWAETSAGSVTAPWAATNQRTFCWACQQSSIVVLTDGEPKYDNNLPSGTAYAAHANLEAATTGTNVGDFRTWSNGKIDCPTCGTDNGNGVPNLVHKVAGFLNSRDLRTESGMAGMQTVQTYTISFGITRASHPKGIAVLEKTADLGGGTFTVSTSAEDLVQALHDAATDVLARATSFSVSNTTPLQTSQNNQLFLARFRPNASPAWEGHLYRFRIFNEFAEGCDATKTTAQQTDARCVKGDGTVRLLNPNRNGDAAGGKAVCASVFIMDADCDEVLENAEGEFKKASFDAGGTLVAGTTDAKPFWDAGRVLSDPTAGGTAYRSADDALTNANRRKIFTVLDTDPAGSPDGKITSSDDLVELSTGLQTTAPAKWAKLQAALGVNATFCGTLFKKMGLYLSAGWDPTTAAGQKLCAEQVIHFARGWDVLDADDDGCGGPSFPTNTTSCPSGLKGEQRNRANDDTVDTKTFWKLGDIFHSSPALVNPPATEFICDLALDNQCVATIHSPKALTGAVQTPIKSDYTVGTSTGLDAYEKYRRGKAQRRRVVLVGANDGMLHAFDAGSPDTSKTADALGNYPYTAGTGAELWAFIPPDLLPKLKNALLGHDYFVDGNIMVRDVWVDGSDGSTRDGTKQEHEFHTIAVLSERSGGTEYVTLDVTNPEAPATTGGVAAPPAPSATPPGFAFRWMYPEPCSIDVSKMGQSWSGFAPRPPPIGPVKLAVPTGGSLDPKGRGFEERWIVMVNGGYDPSMTRGRGIWMMDAWTGVTQWRFTNDEFQDNVNAAGGMWPVPGAVALLDIGTGDQPKVDSDGFFDTATWADVGGQIYVARFNTPDKTRWAAARAFEEQRQATGTQTIASRSEFYFMTANTVDPATGYLHTYIGSGNRERMLTSGASCGPDNVFGCFQAGCNTDVTTKYDYGSCSYVVKAHANGGTIKQDRSTTDGTACADTDISCDQLKIDVRVETVCNGWKPAGGSFHASLDCAADGTCTSAEKVQKGNTTPADRLTNPNVKNRFYGVWAYGGERVFNDWAGAVTYDGRRFTDIPYAGTCVGSVANSCTLVDTTGATVSTAGAVTCASGTSCSADGYGPGWLYEYGHAGTCPLGSGCSTTDWSDEKTGSGATVLAGCVDWNSFRPMGSASSAVSPCEVNAGTARNFSYLADYLTGVPTTTCGTVGTTTIARATTRSTTVPPLDPTHMISLGANGQTTYSVAVIEPGGAPQTRQVGTGNDGNAMIYWLEVPRSLHACRHTGDASQCE
jgi:type IV pilus assembly protein PilY1